MPVATILLLALLALPSRCSSSPRRLGEPSIDIVASDGASPNGWPAAEGGQAGKPASAKACMQLHLDFGASCQVSIDRVAIHFPRGSLQLPTAQQTAATLGALREGGLPARTCCTQVAPLAAARCGCNPSFAASREALQAEYPALTPPYLQGANIIFATACGVPFDAACL